MSTNNESKKAIIETGSKQYFVNEGTILDIEKCDSSSDDSITFDKVLLIQDNDNVTLGKPYIENTTVTGKILEQVKDDKIIVFKFKKKTGYKKKQGHRQKLTRVRIESIGSKPTKTETKTKTESKEKTTEKS